MSRFKALSKLLGISEEAAAKVSKQAAQVLEAVDTPEKAAKLTGANRGTYLKALDEVYGDQAKRSADMGFGPETWYHGTASDIKEFDPGFRGTNTVADNSKMGFFFANTPEVANTYADMASARQITELTPEIRRLIAESNTIADDVERSKLLSKARKLADQNEAMVGKGGYDPYYPIPSYRQNILPVRLKMQSPYVQDLQGGQYEHSLYNAAIRGAKGKQADSALLKNTYDSAAPIEGPRSPDDIAVVFEPHQVRSKFAAFDPRFSKSSSLIAGVAAVPNSKDLTNESPMSWDKLKAYLENPSVALDNLKRIGEQTEGDEVEQARKMLEFGGETPTNDQILAQVEQNRRTLENATGFVGGGIAAAESTPAKSAFGKLKDSLRGKTTRQSLNKPAAEIPAEFGSRADIIRRANEVANQSTDAAVAAARENMLKRAEQVRSLSPEDATRITDVPEELTAALPKLQQLVRGKK